MSNETCTICDGEFSLETEGGRKGEIGILPVAFCPTCLAGIMDFAELEMHFYDPEYLEALFEELLDGRENQAALEGREAAHGHPKNGCALHSLSAPRENTTAVDSTHGVGDDP